MKNKPILIIGYTLILVLSGCIPAQRSVRVKNVNTSPSKAASLSDDVRPLFQLSQADSDADKETLKQLHQRKPDLAELAEQVAADPGNLNRKRQLADAYVSAELYLQAFRLYDELQSKGAVDAALQLGLAQVWHHWDDQAAARRYAESAVAQDPNMTAAWELLGRIHFREKKFAEALAAWEKASKLEPGNAVLFSNIGFSLLIAGDWTNARMYLERAVGINGSLAEAQNHLGIVLARLGDPEGALRHFMTVNAPAAAYNNLGVVYLAQGRKTEAVQQFAHAVELDPIYAIARKNLTETQAETSSPTIVELSPEPSDRPSSQKVVVTLEPAQSTAISLPVVKETAVGETRARQNEVVEAKHSDNNVVPAKRKPTPKMSHALALEPLRMSKVTDTGFYWMMFLTGGFGLAAASELSRACRPGRQDWTRLRRFASFAIIAGVLEVIATRLL